ncbi:hypothetical protein HRbin31_00640 [bacterium HR31]|nr:hypothetical protein HRbin31_00640 [bacterium HR31]
MLQHEHPIRGGQGQGSAAASLPDHHRHRGNRQRHQGGQALRDGHRDPPPLRLRPWVRPGRVHQRHQGQLELARQPHDPARLPESLGQGHAPPTSRLLVFRPPPLLRHHEHRLARQLRQPRHHRRVVPGSPVPVQFHEPVKHPRQVVHRCGPAHAARQLHGFPGGQVRGLRQGRQLRPGSAARGCGAQVPQQVAQHPALLSPRDHHVHQPVLQERLGPVGLLRRRLARSHLHHPRAHEPHQGLRLCHQHVRPHPEGRGHPAERGVRQHRDVGEPRGVVLPRRRRGLRHLQQGQHPLLHPRPTRSGHRDHRKPPPGGPLKGPHHLLPHRGPHGAPQEPEVEGDQHEGLAVQGRLAGHHRLPQARQVPRLRQTFPVRLLVRETQGVHRSQTPVPLPEGPSVRQLGHPQKCRHGQVGVTVRAHVPGSRQHRLVHRVPAPRAADLGRRLPLGHRASPLR